LIHIKELAALVNKSVRTIQHWVAIGDAKPVNADTYRRDGGYMFTEDEVNRLKQIHGKLSSKQAAEMIGITSQYLNQLALVGTVESQINIVGQQKRRFYMKEDIVKLRDHLQERAGKNRKTNRFGKKLILFSKGARLFSRITSSNNQCLITNTAPLAIICEGGGMFKSLPTLDVMEPWPEHKYEQRKGFVDFLFPIPRSIDHPMYDTIRNVIYSLGEKNVQVFETKNGDYFVRCRCGRLPFKEEDFQLLKQNLRNGIIEKSKDRIMLKPEGVTRSVVLQDKVYNIVLEKSKSDKIGFDDALNELILKINED